jgi:hypothetical protein
MIEEDLRSIALTSSLRMKFDRDEAAPADCISPDKIPQTGLHG